MKPTWRGRVARGVHRVLVRLAPRETRRAYGVQMTETFDALSRDADAAGIRATIRLLAREALHMLTAHAPERRTIFPTGGPESRQASRRSLFDGLGGAHVWRSLARRPVFAATIIFTLALGSGIATALFAVVETVLVRDLPYPDADRLVTVHESSPTAPGRGTMAAAARIEDWHHLSQTFAAISSSYGESVTDSSVADPERLRARRATPRYFAVYAAPAVAGRTFLDAEEVTGGPAAAVISDTFWLRRFARDPAAIGAKLIIAGVSHPIVGVMSPTFASDVDVWLLAQLSPQLQHNRGARFLWGIGRLKTGVTIGQARADLKRVEAALAESHPATDKGWAAVIGDLKEARVGARAVALWLAYGAVAVVWLIGVANVAALVLADTYRRERELAIRSALGASRRRVAAMVVVEAAIMALAGGAAGLLLATGILNVVPRWFPTLPRLEELSINWRSYGFAMLASLAAGAICGLVPAWRATARGVSPVLARGSRGNTSSAHRLQRWLVGVQVALGVVLCSSAAFLAASYHRLTSVDRGFRTDGLVTFRVAALWGEDRPRIGQMQVDLLAALERHPGVTAAGFASFLPAPGGDLRYQVTVDAPAIENGAGSVGVRLVSRGYLRAVGVPLRDGELCAPLRVDFDMPATGLVNQAFVDRYAQGQNLIGRQLRFTDRPERAITIVGVIGNIAEDGPRMPPFPFLYTCNSAGSWPDPNYVVRTSDPVSLVANLRAQVRQIDPTRAVFGIRILEDVLDDAVAEPRTNASVMGSFALAALIVGAVGLYALFARLVAESRREIGVRLALGAAPGAVFRLVVTDAGRLLVAGALAGCALSAAAFQFLRAVLFNVGPSDTVLVTAVTLTLLAAAGIPVIIPAVRASRVAPTDALRSDG